MAAQKAPRRVTIGGIVLTERHHRNAIDVLTGSAGVMVKQPLLKAGLAACDYHSVADRQRAVDGNSAMSTKPGLILALEAALSGFGAE